MEERASMQGGRGRRERDKELMHVGCGGEREKERKSAGMSGGEKEKALWLFLPGPALCKLGLARSAVHST